MGTLRNRQVYIPKDEEHDLRETLESYIETYFPKAKIEYFT